MLNKTVIIEALKESNPRIVDWAAQELADRAIAQAISINNFLRIRLDSGRIFSMYVEGLQND